MLDDTLAEFLGLLSDEQREAFRKLERELTLARRYARIAALRLARKEDDELEEKLHNLKALARKSEDYDRAVVEIEREAHEHSGRLSDVIKSLFMWKKSPDEHLK